MIGSEHHELSRFLAIILYVAREVTSASSGPVQLPEVPRRLQTLAVCANPDPAPFNFPHKHCISLIRAA